MPDPDHHTISASQTGALFDVSPYASRYMLHRHFADKIDIDDRSGPEAAWGLRLQQPIMDATAEKLGLTIVPNVADDYSRHDNHPLGCTRDGDVLCPTRGSGVVEVKNVDRMIFHRNWTETAAPPHIELQVQTQLLVTDTKWACIAALVGGNDLQLFERFPVPEIQDAIINAAAVFFDNVARDREPDPTGIAAEIPALAQLYPVIADAAEILDMTTSPTVAQLIADYASNTAATGFHKKAAEHARTKLLALAKDFGNVRAHGWLLKVQKSPIKEGVIRLPDELRTRIYNLLTKQTPSRIRKAELITLLRQALDWSHVTRKASLQQRLKATALDDGPATWPDALDTLLADLEP